MKGLYLRGGIWWLRYSTCGRQVRVSTGEADEAAAIHAAIEIKGRNSGIGGHGNLSLESYLSHKQKQGASRIWLRNARHWLTNALGSLGQTPSAPRIQAWFDGVQARLRPQTATTYLDTLSRYLEYCVSRGLLVRNPCRLVERPKLVPACRRRFLTRQEARRLLDACNTDPLKFAVYCGLHAGLRKEEVIQSIPAWFDLRAGLLHVTASQDWHPKDKENRTIPLTDEFRAWLAARTWEGPFMLAPDVRQGSHRYRFDFRRAFNSAVKRADLRGVTFHDLRRTFASLLVSSGVSLYKTARWLGVGHGVVERHYGHLIPQDAEVNKAWIVS